jgi:hypothetical protein
MKRFALLAFALTGVAVSAQQSHADVLTPTAFRCAADQLLGHPSDEAKGLGEGRTGYGRQAWANNAYGDWAYGQGQTTLKEAQRYWLPNTYNTEVETYASQFDTDLYPVYAGADGSIWVGPGPANATWHGTTRDSINAIPHTGAFQLPLGIAITAVCEAGCYMPDQKLQMGNQSVSVVDAQSKGVQTLTTLTPDATIDSVKLMNNQVGRWTVDIAPANQTIFTLTMKSGGSLRVTNEHPLVTGEGVMKQAQNLVVGESLVRDSGDRDPIVSIAKATEFTKVYNVRPTTTDLTTNVLVAQGYLAGSAAYQNEYLKYLNRVLFRATVPSTIIPRAARTATKPATRTAAK